MDQSFPKNGFLFWIGIFVMALLVALDQFTKHLAVLYLKNAPAVPILPGIFELTYLENRGAAFGILQGQNGFLLLTTVVTTVVLVYFYIRIPKQKRYFSMHVLLILLIPGAIGNFIDRWTHNYVIDFFYVRLIDFPVFNVADIYVSVATVLLIFFFCFYYKEEDIDLLLNRLAFWNRKS